VIDDPVFQSFERLAELEHDITPDVYRRYYALAPAAEETMSHVDCYMQGRMMTEVLELLMTPPADVSANYLAFETANHTRSYGVDLALYRPLFESVRDVVRSALGAAWAEGFDEAWSVRIDALESAVIKAAAQSQEQP
jgi:hypothetical protein